MTSIQLGKIVKSIQILQITGMIIWLISSALAAHAEATSQPWMQPDVIKAAVAMNLSEQQQLQFKSAVSELINQQVRASNKLLRRNNVTDLERHVKSLTNRQMKAFDDDMATILTTSQQAPYQHYRALLRGHLIDAALGRGKSSDATMDNASSALHNAGHTH